MKPRILLVEDEKSISAGLIYNLEKHGYSIELAERGDVGLKLATTESFDLILLDVMLPGMDGYSVCTKLRELEIHTPILMLTARSEKENLIHGLRVGADDYLGKPFHLEELLTRVATLLRRRTWDHQAVSTPHSLYLLGCVEFDANRLELRNKDKIELKVELTAMETKLLEMLVQENGRSVSRAQILKQVWGLKEDTQTRTLDNFIMRLRQHLNQVGGQADWIESVRGVGYRLREL